MEDKQQLQRMSNGYGTFFQSSARTTLDHSSSLLFNLFRIFYYFSLIKLVSGNNSLNSFTFIQNTTYYLLTTSSLSGPGAQEQGYDYTVKAYQSIVNSLLNGKLGPIVQSQSSVNTHSILSMEVCKASLELESNGPESAVASFLDDFIHMVKEDSAYIEAKKLCANMVFDLKFAAIIFGAIIVIACIAVGVLALCHARTVNRGDYQPIEEGSIAMEENNKTTLLRPSFMPT